MNEAAPHPSYLWRGLQTVDVNLLRRTVFESGVRLDGEDTGQSRRGRGPCGPS